MTGQTKYPQRALRQNYICNFRAPNEEKFAIWQQWKEYCKDNGRDVCQMTLSLIESAMSNKSFIMTGVADPKQVVHIHNENTFTYAVKKPRRVPYDLSIVKREHRKTFSSIIYESYVKMRCHELRREVSFRDFLELDKDGFHRIMRRLIKKNEMIRNPIRTVPQFYFLPELIDIYRPLGP